MSDWLRGVEHASYNVQYSGDSTESNPLLSYQARDTKCHRYFWMMFLVILFVVGTGIGFYLLLQDEPQWPDKCSFVYISRDAWKAAPKSVLLNHYTADQKLTHVQISQTSTRACYDYVECSQELRFLQSSHVGRNLSDIAYNFIVAGDGRTYEGRGWDYKPGLLPDDIGNKTFTVGFLGTFDYIQPSRSQVQQTKIIIQDAINRGVLDKCFSLTLFKENPQDGGGQMVHVYKKLINQIEKRKKLAGCS